MNQVFSFNRFGMLFKKHTVENLRGYLMATVVLVGIITIVMLIGNHYSDLPMPISLQAVYFVTFLFAAGTLFTSNVFAKLGTKKQAIATLTLPCTTFEKFLVAWLYSYIIFQAVYILVYYCILLPMLHIGHWSANVVEVNNVFDNSAGDASITFVTYAFLHSVVLFGAVYFKKMHFIKTAFAFFIIVLVIWLVNGQLLSWLTHLDASGNTPFSGIRLKKDNQYRYVELNQENRLLALFATLSVMMWVATYFRLKEKQV